MTPLISVIIPVYNVEKYLPACIKSLISQTYKNIEIILVDDGATDSSGEICDKYAQTDSRIKVIHKKNAGVSEARNTGMEQMHGEYFCFVDGDDYVHPEYAEAMYSLICEYDADISMCGYVYKWADGKERITKNFEYPDTEIFFNSGKEAMELMLYGKIYSPSCNGKLYNRKKISFKFDRYAIGEDFLASINYYQQTNKAVMSNRRLYYYIQHDESVMHSFEPDKIFSMVETCDEMLKCIPSADNKLMSAAAYYTVEKNLMALMKLYGIKEQEEKISHIYSNLKMYRSKVIFDSNAQMRTRIACIISYFGIKILVAVRNLTAK